MESQWTYIYICVIYLGRHILERQSMRTAWAKEQVLINSGQIQDETPPKQHANLTFLM